MIVILQGRIGSNRLPAKGFLNFFDKTIWERICLIAKDISGVEKIVFATGSDKKNLVAKEYIENLGINFFVGDEDNVLSRFQEIINSSKSEYFLRLTCDNYLIQPEVIEKLFLRMKTESTDYAYVQPLSHFSGEIININFFKKFYEDTAPSEMAKEHVTYDIRNSKRVKKTIAGSNFLGIDHAKSLTLDTLEDYVHLKTIENLYPKLKDIRCIDEIKKLQTETKDDFFN